MPVFILALPQPVAQAVESGQVNFIWPRATAVAVSDAGANRIGVVTLTSSE